VEVLEVLMVHIANDSHASSDCCSNFSAFNLDGEQYPGPIYAISISSGTLSFAGSRSFSLCHRRVRSYQDSREIQVEGYVEDEATAVGTDPPPVPTRSDPRHFAFIREVRLRPDRSFVLEVYPVLPLTSTGEALPTYNRTNDAAVKAALLPLPPFVIPTPHA